MLIALCGAGLSVVPVSAQNADLATTAPSLSNPVSTPAANVVSSQRDAEYAALARDVETLGREFSLVMSKVQERTGRGELLPLEEHWRSWGE